MRFTAWLPEHRATSKEIAMLPHDLWAGYYDFVYEQAFGRCYRDLTDLTLRTIAGLHQPPCAVVDFGAGTGRLSVPLAAAGYVVTAIEPSGPMLDVLQKKARAAGVRIDSRAGRMQDCALPADYDIALCLFTTISYLLDEDSLAAGLRCASAAGC